MIRLKGYTLVEVILLIVVLLVFLGISTMTWLHYSSNFRRYLFASRIHSALHYARSKAILLDQKVIYCGSRDGQHCDGDWTAGQLVKVASTGKILKKYPAFDGVGHLNFSANFGRRRSVEFLSNGETQGQKGHFSFCASARDTRVRYCSWVTIDFTGQTEVVQHCFSQ